MLWMSVSRKFCKIIALKRVVIKNLPSANGTAIVVDEFKINRLPISLFVASHWMKFLFIHPILGVGMACWVLNFRGR